jgi:isopentenyl phosphate kinase
MSLHGGHSFSHWHSVKLTNETSRKEYLHNKGFAIEFE